MALPPLGSPRSWSCVVSLVWEHMPWFSATFQIGAHLSGSAIEDVGSHDECRSLQARYSRALLGAFFKLWGQERGESGLYQDRGNAHMARGEWHGRSTEQGRKS